MDAAAPLSQPFARNLEVLVHSEATWVRTKRNLDRDTIRRVRALPAGAAVLVWGPSHACRKFADLTGVEIDHEFLPVPHAGSPAYLVENAQECIDYFCSTLLTLPPRCGWIGPIGEVFMALARAGRHSPRLAAAIRGRVLVGRRR